MADIARQSAIGPSERPLVIVGMHRSGTSLAASLVAGAGLDLGSNLLGAGIGNPQGHYEDLDFLNLHKQILASNSLDEDGFTCLDNVTVPSRLAAAAAALIADRQSKNHGWGWKDPRTTLLLEFYERLLPDARFLCVFRRPWEVVDSLLRRGYSGDKVFEDDPVLAARLYHHYNLRLLTLAERIAHRCLVVESAQLAADPGGVIRRIGGLLEMPLDDPPPVFDRDLMHVDGSANRAAIMAAACPDAMDVYVRLRRIAGSDAAVEDIDERTSQGRLGELALLEWAKHARSARELKAATTHVQQVQTAMETAQAACNEAHIALQAVIEQRDSLAAYADAQAADLQTLRQHADAQAGDLHSLGQHAHAQAADLRSLRQQADAQAVDLQMLQEREATQQQEVVRLCGRVADLQRQVEDCWNRRLARCVRRLVSRLPLVGRRRVSAPAAQVLEASRD